MPFRSKAQRRKFARLLVEGKIKPAIFEEWNRETGGKVLPERVRPKKKTAAKRRRTPTRRKQPRRRRPAQVAREACPVDWPSR